MNTMETVRLKNYRSKKEWHPTKNIFIEFNEIDHSYVDNYNNTYTSVTTLISKYFPLFDSDKIAERCAVKRGVNKQSLLDKWKRIGDEAAKKGNEVHNYLDASISNKTLPNIDGDYKRSSDIIISSLTNKYKLQMIYSEKLLFSPQLKIAGTVDAVFYSPIINKYIIMDWKTSKRIEMANDFNQRGLNGFEHLEHCNHVHYSLQLLMYQYLLYNEGYLKNNINAELKIVNIHKAIQDCKSYDVLNLNSEVQTLINNINKKG